MKTTRFILLIAVSLLFSCLPKKPDISGTEVPAGPLVQAVDRQRLSVAALKALATVEVDRRGRKRVFDSVGIVIDARRRLRIEVFGPLGQSELALVWDGSELLLRLPDDDRIVRPGQAGIERMLGIGIEVQDLCAVLSGTVMAIARPLDARAYCTQDAACVLELPDGDMVRRVRVLPGPVTEPHDIRIAGMEAYRSDNLVYRARYEGMQELSRVLLPRTIVLENPERGMRVTIEYADVDVNTPISEDAFALAGSEAGAP